MAKKLHELLAVEGDLQRAADHVATEALTTFEKRRDHFWSTTKRTTFFDDGRSGENTEDVKAMETTVQDKLDYLAKMQARYIDAVLGKDMTNQTATADLIVDGETLATGLPATFLLGLENKLQRLRQVYMAMPTLSPGVAWEPDPSAGPDIFKAPPSKTFKTEKQIQPVVLYEATKEHPAQVRERSVDVPVAAVEASLQSGALSVARKSTILDRLDSLIRATKKARQRANAAEVTGGKIGNTLFAYIHGVDPAS